MIIQGDALEEMQKLEDESIDCCITSPPYWGLRDYGTATWEDGNNDCDHIKTPLCSDKSGLAGYTSENIKLRTNGMPYKNVCGKCGAKRIDRQLGLEPTFTEYIDKLCNVFDEVKRVLKPSGSCWVNLGDTYSSVHTGGFKSEKSTISNATYLSQEFKQTKQTNLPDKTLVQIPARFSIEMSNRGWILRNTIIWHKPSCMPASVTDRFTVDFEYVFFFTKNKSYYFEQQFEPALTNDNLLRNRDTTKLNNTPGRSRMAGLIHNNYERRNKRTVWSINPKEFKEAHFAVYPEKLLETPIKATLPPDGTVLDPFFGSGTTEAAQRRWQPSAKTIGIELNSEYIKIAEKRNNQGVLAL